MRISKYGHSGPGTHLKISTHLESHLDVIICEYIHILSLLWAGSSAIYDLEAKLHVVTCIDNIIL